MVELVNLLAPGGLSSTRATMWAKSESQACDSRDGTGGTMAHRTFFSFHYDDDVWRAGVVRNRGALKKDDIEFIDASLWEEAETQGDAAVKKLIDDALARSTVTCVLIGATTASRRWVKYEIGESIRLGKGLFGV